MTEQSEIQPKKKSSGSLRTAIRVLCFLLVLALVLHGTSTVMKANNVFGSRNIGGFYELQKDSLDAVYIGSSRVYAFWNPLAAFRNYGIAVFGMATAAQPIDAARYLVEEAHKTQPHAVMIINLEAFRDDWYASLHRITDWLRFSPTKLRFIWSFSKRHGIRIKDRFEYVCPLYLYHSRWQELTPEDFTVDTGKFMSTSCYSGYLSGCMDVSAVYPAPVEAVTPVSAEAKDVLDELIDYCSENSIPLLFTLAPQAKVTEEELMLRNGLRDYVRSRGCTVLDYQNSLEELGIDTVRDYVNTRHTNIHGSLKFTAHLADYLVRTYGFSDKRGTVDYGDWEKALADYDVKVESNVLPFEWQPGNRTDLPAVTPDAKALEGGGVRLSFSPVEGADGYAVFRKVLPETRWTWIADITEEMTDPEGKAGAVYVVVPYIEKDGVRLYGAVDYAGTQAA